MTSRLVKVAPSVPLPNSAPQSYTYALPSEVDTPQLFTPVTIPFGPRVVPGVVVSLVKQPVKYRTKTVLRAYAWQLTAHQVAFAEWMHRTMQGGLGYTLRLFFPVVTQSVSVDPALVSHEQIPSRRSTKATRAELGILLEKDVVKRVKALTVLARGLIKKNSQLLVIVPEKWMVERLVHLLENKSWTVASVHSDVPAREYATLWEQVRQGKIDIVVGTQKAFFLPFLKLGAIVVEEEFMTTHKLWDQYPRLDNRLAADEYARITGASLYYFSSALSPHLLLLSEQNENPASVSHNRTFTSLAGTPLVPRVEIFSTTVADQQARHILPNDFIQKLNQWLRSGEQVLLLHNVRGNWQVLGCSACQAVVRCQECGVAMVTHGVGKSRKLMCRHCSQSAPYPDACAVCKKKKLRPFGLGAEKLGEIIAQSVGRTTSLAQVDATTLRRAPMRRKVLKTQLVIATSAIFTQVPAYAPDRAVYMFPERGLLYPDYRSAERTYATMVRLQQLVSVNKKVSIVTKRARFIRESLSLSPTEFCSFQLKERKRLNYPPYTTAVLLTVRSQRATQLQEKIVALRRLLDERVVALEGAPVQVRGPFTGFVKKKRDKFESHILLLGEIALLQKLYDGLVFDVVDVAPERIL